MQNVNMSAFLNSLRLHRHKLIISIIWLLGLSVGKLFAYIRPWDFISADMFLDNAGSQPVAVLLTASTVLVGCLACAISNHLLFLMLFCKATAYTIVSANIIAFFGEAGWLLWILLLSIEAIQISVLLLFSLQSVGQGFGAIKRNAIIATIISLILVLLDVYLTTPFTTSLLNG